jgi:hypothetical protein
MIHPKPISNQVPALITRRRFVSLPLAGFFINPSATTQQVEDLVILDGWVIKRSEIRLTVMSQK